MGSGAEFGQGEETLRRAAAETQDTQGKLRTTRNTLEADVTGMAAKWAGQGGRAFQQMMDEWGRKQEEIIQVLTDFENGLHQTDKTNKATDEEAASNVQSTAGQVSSITATRLGGGG